MKSAGDTRGFERALARVHREAGAALRSLAVVAKIEGTATLNDSSRELASLCLGAALARAGSAAARRGMLEILSVGCEGVISPGGTLFASVNMLARPPAGAPGLVMGHGRSPALPMRDRASLRHVEFAATAVRAAMRDAGLAAREVALVLIKSPVLLAGAEPPRRAADRRHAGSTGASRGAASLGAAIALGELRRAAVGADALLRDTAVHGTRTLAFSGTEVEGCEALVFGHRLGGDPSLRLERAMLADLLDLPALEVLARAPGEPRAIFFKAGIPEGGRLRGARTTVLSSELAADKQLRGAAGGIAAAVFGTPRVFVSGGAEHQAPPGGCIAAVIWQVR